MYNGCTHDFLFVCIDIYESLCVYSSHYVAQVPDRKDRKRPDAAAGPLFPTRPACPALPKLEPDDDGDDVKNVLKMQQLARQNAKAEMKADAAAKAKAKGQGKGRSGGRGKGAGRGRGRGRAHTSAEATHPEQEPTAPAPKQEPGAPEPKQEVLEEVEPPLPEAKAGPKGKAKSGKRKLADKENDNPEGKAAKKVEGKKKRVCTLLETEKDLCPSKAFLNMYYN